MSRLRRIEQQDRVFFITTNLARNLAHFTPAERDLILDSLSQTRGKHRFSLLGYVVMPDHLHLLIATTDRLSDIMHNLKRRSAFAIGKSRRTDGPLWQSRYFDSICRHRRDVGKKLEYIHDNPVVGGLVKRADEWLWSSACFYSKTRAPIVLPDPVDFSGDPDDLLWPAPWRRV